MNRLAKRLYNIAPEPVRLTFADGSTVELSMRSAEFFQDDLEAEGETDDGTAYRIVNGDDEETLLVAREGDDGWTVVGDATGVEAV
ncbi:hypothetical protein [Haloarchaeobius iranensis]|uniref:DUF8072 domain-containing protein n=1 Tax=Haloarchaeobius iranensis TaxID=996166 RepID=A0A1G9Y084_9EURY|nr:hypothetical protein [Haloarchaeobius iranensis]SDN02457.1 hypothetical protein SAMN05192554_11281 [Haloarchaeobius iranensis]